MAAILAVHQAVDNTTGYPTAEPSDSLQGVLCLLQPLTAMADMLGQSSLWWVAGAGPSQCFLALLLFGRLLGFYGNFPEKKMHAFGVSELLVSLASVYHTQGRNKTQNSLLCCSLG